MRVISNPQSACLSNATEAAITGCRLGPATGRAHSQRAEEQKWVRVCVWERGGGRLRGAWVTELGVCKLWSVCVCVCECVCQDTGKANAFLWLGLILRIKQTSQILLCTWIVPKLEGLRRSTCSREILGRLHRISECVLVLFSSNPLWQKKYLNICQDLCFNYLFIDFYLFILAHNIWYEFYP